MFDTTIRKEVRLYYGFQESYKEFMFMRPFETQLEAFDYVRDHEIEIQKYAIVNAIVTTSFELIKASL